MIEFSPKNKIKPKKGRILLSEPFLEDPYFKRTVVLLCEHNEDGSFGFILNRYVDMKITEILKEFPDLKTRIGVGGPVQNQNLFYLHTLGDKIQGSRKVCDGVYMGGNFDIIKILIESDQIKESEIRFFIGYAGWSENQLEHELNEKSWIVAKASKEDVMSTSDVNLWSKVLKSLGKEYSYLANFPEDPSLN